MYGYTCHKCGREIDIPPTIAESRYLIRCPSCYEFIHTGFQSKPYVPRVESGSREEVAEELIYWRKQAILFRNDEGVTDEELNNAQTGLNKTIEKADELNLKEDELYEAERRIRDREHRAPRGIPREDKKMPCPRCKASIMQGSAYCSHCGYCLFERPPQIIENGRPPQIEKNYQIFLCHSHKDESFVMQLANDLESDKIDVWVDEWDIEVGDFIHKKIEDGIRNSTYLGIILSPDSVCSKWVDKELRAALAIESQKGKKFVLPILYKDCEIPLFLKDTHYADCRSNTYTKGLEKLKKVIKKD